MADAQTSAEASPAEMQAWLDAHADVYRLQPSYSLRQVYFDPARQGKRLDTAIAAARSALARGAKETPGDATMLPETLDAASITEVARVFGNDFAAALANLPVGEWQGPIASEFGVHLVMIEARQPGRLPTLAEVKPAVQRDLLRARVEQSGETYYQSLRQRYAVRVEAIPEIALDSGKLGSLAKAN
jgi:parvulin-like peptidyl-prolyl isomerase